jgi:hypothetical protein
MQLHLRITSDSTELSIIWSITLVIKKSPFSNFQSLEFKILKWKVSNREYMYNYIFYNFVAYYNIKKKYPKKDGNELTLTFIITNSFGFQAYN